MLTREREVEIFALYRALSVLRLNWAPYVIQIHSTMRMGTNKATRYSMRACDPFAPRDQALALWENKIRGLQARTEDGSDGTRTGDLRPCQAGTVTRPHLTLTDRLDILTRL